MYQVDVYLRVRRAVMVDGMSIREVSRVFGLHRDTVRKILAYSAPPGYRRQTPPRRPNPSTSSGGALHRRHRPNPGRRPQASQEAAPHSPADLPAAAGRARVQWPVHHSQGLRKGAPPPVAGDVRPSVSSAGPRPVRLWRGPGDHRRGGQKAHCFVLDLPHSDGCFVKAYPAETTEAFLGGHVLAFAFLGGVPQSILYDNTKLAMARILGDGRRKRTRAFTELQSHYLFEDRFGRPGKGNDKGKVEGMVGYMRRNFLVPVPSFESFEALNAHPESRCLARMDARLRGHSESIGQRMKRDLDALLPLAPVAYDACERQAGRVSSLSLVRYKTNDYSVPVSVGHRHVLVKGYVDRVVVSCGSEVIARHHRSYQRDDFVFDPVHYLPLLEQKTGALDQAAPLAGMGPARGVCHAAPVAGVPHGTKGQAGVRPGTAAIRAFFAWGGPRRGSGCHPVGDFELRRGEAFGALPSGGTAAPPRPGAIPLPARVSVNTTSAGDYMALLSGRAA